MRIKRTSWHWRLINWTYGQHPSSLCPYFWLMSWCMVTAVPRVFFRRLGKSLTAAVDKSDDRNVVIYRALSDLAVLRIALDEQSVENLINRHYTTYDFPHSVKIWWGEQEKKGRDPAKILSELAQSYRDGQIVFKGLSIKQAIMRVVVSYFGYWWVGATSIIFILSFSWITQLYFSQLLPNLTVLGAVAFGFIISVVIIFVVCGALFNGS